MLSNQSFEKLPRYVLIIYLSGEICNYHINRSVIQGFLALRKAVTTHVKKYCIVYVCWCSQSAAYTSLAFGATRSGWWMNGKSFTILNTSCLSELSQIMAVKTLKNPYRWQTMRFKLSWKGKKTIIPKEKACVNSTSHSFAALTRELSSYSLKEKFHIYARPYIILFITPILKSVVVPVIWLSLIGAIYSRIAPFFALNHIFSPVSEEATLKTKQPIRFQGLFKVTNQIAGKWKTKSIKLQILQIFVSKTLIFELKMNWRWI